MKSRCKAASITLARVCSTSSASIPSISSCGGNRADPNHPERKGRLRSVSSLNQGNGTSPFVIGYTYADEPVCPDPDNCPEPGPPGQMKTMTRGDITTALGFDGFVPIRETHTIAPSSPTGLANTEYQINLNADFQPQADQVEANGTTFTATYSYDADNVLTCASHGGACNPGFGIAYHFDSGATDSAPSGNGLLESTTSGAITETFTHNSFGELATHTVNLAFLAHEITHAAQDAISPRGWFLVHGRLHG